MKLITYTSAAGFPGVLSGPQLSGESDADFTARLTALSLPAGSTNVQTIDAADYTPPASSPVPPTPREWLERLSPTTQQAISAAAIASPSILLWLLKASGSATIDVMLQETIDGVAALVTAGVLTTDDQAVLLAA